MAHQLQEDLWNAGSYYRLINLCQHVIIVVALVSPDCRLCLPKAVRVCPHVPQPETDDYLIMCEGMTN